MDRFSIKRIWYLLKLDYSHSPEAWIGNTASAFAAMTVLTLSLLWIGDFTSFEDFANRVMIILVALISAGVAINSAMMFSSMNTKPKRTAYLTIPATHLEKFVVNTFEVTVALAIQALAGFFLADAVRIYLLQPMFSLPADYDQWIMTLMIKMLAGKTVSIDHGGIAVSTTLLFFLWMQSFFVAGSALWRRYPGQRTIAVGIIMVITIIGIFDLVPDVSYINTEMIEWGVSAWTLINWILAYRFFTRSQLK